MRGKIGDILEHFQIIPVMIKLLEISIIVYLSYYFALWRESFLCHFYLCFIPDPTPSTRGGKLQR